MALFVVSGSGTIDLSAQSFTGFTGIDFQSSGALRVLLSNLQFGAAQLPTDAEFNAHPGFASVVEISVDPGLTFVGSSFNVSTFGADDYFVFNDATGNESLTGTQASDTFVVDGGGTDFVDGNLGTNTLVVNYSDLANGVFSSGSSFTNFAGRGVSYANIQLFNITTGSGGDNFVTGDGADTVSSGGGEDIIDTAKGVAIVDGGTGNDGWYADFSLDATVKTIDLSLSGVQSAGNGTTYTSIERLRVTGGSANDVFISRTGNPNDGLADTLNGGTGNDRLTVGGGGDTVDGGTGTDTLTIDYSTDALGFFMASGNTIITDFLNTSVTFSNIERFIIRLGSGSDNIITGNDTDEIYGGAGNDTLNSARGVATIDGGADNDTWIADYSNTTTAKTVNLNLGGVQGVGDGSTYADIEAVNLTGGAGDDIFTSRTGNPNDGLADTLNGGLGLDTLTVGGGGDTVDGGGGGDDLLIVDYATDTGNFSMAGGNTIITDFSNTSVTFANIEHFHITTGSGSDSIVTGAGADILRGGLGNDILNGGTGVDLIDWQDATTSVVASLTNAGGGVTSAAGIGTDSYLGFENMAGGSAGDNLTGNNRANTLFGNAGDDVLRGGGNNDTLIGGLGRDTLTGGIGDDTFVFRALTDSTVAATGRDIVSDFVHASDKFDLRAIDGVPGGVQDPLTFIGSAAFTALGQVRVFDNGTDTFVEVNATGTLAADMAVRLTGVIALDVGDFVFV